MTDKLKTWVSLHYFLNLLACLLYPVSRSIQPICYALYNLDDDGECNLDWRDTEVLLFLCFIIVLKNRRWKPLSNIEYISNIFLFSKCANVILLFRRDIRWGVLYLIFCFVMFLVLPEPAYTGPEKITFFRGQGLDEELLQHPEKTWIVEFYANWATPCSRLAPTFAKLSLNYDHQLLKFGKIDVNKYEKLAQKYGVDVSVTSKNLPTLIVFENGKEKLRRPIVDSKGSVTPYIFKEENIIRDLNLNELYAAAKEKEKKVKSNKEKKNK